MVGQRINEREPTIPKGSAKAEIQVVGRQSQSAKTWVVDEDDLSLMQVA